MEITIERRGECNNCGLCCRGCIHLEPKFEGVKIGFYKCNIREKLADYCETCHQHHSSCITYPDRPNRFEMPECGYRFFTREGTEVIRIQEIEQ